MFVLWETLGHYDEESRDSVLQGVQCPLSFEMGLYIYRLLDQDIIIMSTNCAACGYRDNEVKSGGAVSDHGKKITLRVEDSDDLARDILKVCLCSHRSQFMIL